jgi:hypothetical protein
MDMLPNNYSFKFDNENVQLNISGCTFDKSMIYAQLQDSNGNGLAGGDFQYRIGYGSYTTIGTNVPTGGVWYLLAGTPTNVKVKVFFKGGSKEVEQNITNNSKFIFQTVNVTADLKNSSGALLTADTWQYRYGWGTYSTLNNTGEELLPVNLKVKVGYKGATVEKEQNVGSAPHFDFNTVNVTADLKDSGNKPLTASSWQYRYGWGSYSTLNNLGEELLPVNVKVNVSYKGASVEKEQNVGTSPNFLFNTVKVTADIQDVNGNSLMASTWDYRYGWGSYSPLTIAGEELLPVKVKVRVGFKGATEEKEQDVKNDAYFEFQTVNVSAKLLNGYGDVSDEATWQYRYGWGLYSPLNYIGEEMLPVDVKVKVTHPDYVGEKEQFVGSYPYFEFIYDNVVPNELEGEADPYATDLALKVYPNPVTYTANVSLSIPTAGYTQVAVYDLNGRLIDVLYEGDLQVGPYTFEWNAENQTAGTYFCRLLNGKEVKTVRIFVTR